MKRTYIILITFLFALVIIFITTNLAREQVSTKPTPSSVPTPTPRVVLGISSKSTGCKIVNAIEDKECTPGAIDPRVNQDNLSQTICMSGYTKTVRPPVSFTNRIKQERMAAYGFFDNPSNYELDHLVPLELGGCPDCISNLWPEPAYPTPGYHQKDIVENYLNKQVCSGKIPLQVAQDEIVSDWVNIFYQINR